MLIRDVLVYRDELGHRFCLATCDLHLFPTKTPVSALLFVSNLLRLFRRKGISKLQADTDMHATVRPSAGNCLVAISGRITIDSSPDLRTLLFQCLGSKSCDSLTADFSEVIYVDGSALAVLLETLGAARRLNKAFHLASLRDQPRYLLENTRLLHLFDQAPNEEPN